MDLLKYDNCNNQGRPALERYTAMADALAASGRDIVYSICEWGSNRPWEWAAEVGGHYWRTTGDISDSWGSMVSIVDQQVGLEAYSGPDAWNDPDMLEVGNGGMTTEEYRAHMSLWSLLNAPLIAGNDLRSMDATTLALLTDPDVLAVNQDWAGVQGHRIADAGDQEVWAKPLSDGGAAVVLFNRAAAGAPVETSAAALGLPDSPAYTMRDLWADTETVTSGPVRASVPAHGAAMFEVRPGAADGTPSVTATVTADAYVAPGDLFPATVTVTNDGVTPASPVDVALSVPDGWTATPTGSPTIPALAPGETAAVPYDVQLPAPVPNGAFPLTATLRHGTATSTAYGTVTVAVAPAGSPWVSDLGPVSAQVGWGSLELDRSVDGNPLTIAGTVYDKGLAAHAPSDVRYYLGGACTTFTARAGVDDETGGLGAVTFTVTGDGRTLARTDVVGGGTAAVQVEADVTDVTELRLLAGTGPGDDKNYDHSEWVDAQLTCGSAG